MAPSAQNIEHAAEIRKTCDGLQQADPDDGESYRRSDRDDFAKASGSRDDGDDDHAGEENRALLSGPMNRSSPSTNEPHAPSTPEPFRKHVSFVNRTKNR